MADSFSAWRIPTRQCTWDFLCGLERHQYLQELNCAFQRLQGLGQRLDVDHTSPWVEITG